MHPELAPIETATLIGITADVVAAYVSNNSLPPSDFVELIKAVHQAVAKVAEGEPVAPVEEPPAPAVPIKKSLTNDFIICLEDGRKMKSMKRHLSTAYGLTPDEYRAKWGLPNDYPMVAPSYAAARSALAKNMGLGRVAEKVVSVPVKKADAEPTKRGRPRKAA